MAEMSEEQAQAMTNAIFAGQKIEAIKICKAATGKSLKEAKATVDYLERELREESPEKFTAPAGGGGGGGCGAVVLVAVFMLLTGAVVGT